MEVLKLMDLVNGNVYCTKNHSLEFYNRNATQLVYFPHANVNDLLKIVKPYLHKHDCHDDVLFVNTHSIKNIDLKISWHINVLYVDNCLIFQIKQFDSNILTKFMLEDVDLKKLVEFIELNISM